jgi:hypothetical protein
MATAFEGGPGRVARVAREQLHSREQAMTNASTILVVDDELESLRLLAHIL